MTEQFTRVSVSLTRDEFIALARLAQKESRLPKQQARHLLRTILSTFPMAEHGQSVIGGNVHTDEQNTPSGG